MRLIHSMRLQLLALPVFILAGYCLPVSAQKCLTYEPTVVSLTGTLRSQVFAGPPNYESIKRGDRKETAIILTLTAKTCTARNEGDDLDVSEIGIHEVQ